MQILMVKSMLYYTVKGETNLSKYDMMGDRGMTNLNTIYNLIKEYKEGGGKIDAYNILSNKTL